MVRKWCRSSVEGVLKRWCRLKRCWRQKRCCGGTEMVVKAAAVLVLKRCWKLKRWWGGAEVVAKRC